MNDGTDTDLDGLCDSGDPDDDNDGVLDGVDTAPLSPFVCGDADGDGCDDCTIGVDGLGPLSDNTPMNDGPDFDSDGICDLTDPPCPVDVILSNTNTSGTTTLIEVENNITSTALIQTGAIVDYSAGTSIHLLPGTEVELGSVFHAYIDGCNN